MFAGEPPSRHGIYGVDSSLWISQDSKWVNVFSQDTSAANKDPKGMSRQSLRHPKRIDLHRDDYRLEKNAA